MKLGLNKKSVLVLRELANTLPKAIDNIKTATMNLMAIYKANEDALGVHSAAFLDMLLCVKRAQDASAEAILALPPMLRKTAEKIEAYIHKTPADLSASGGAAAVKHAPAHRAGDSDSSEIGQRTIFEITALMDTLELTAGDPSVVQMGGIYKDVKAGVDSSVYEVHHIPPQSVFADSGRRLPAIAMLKEDHAKTSSFRGKMKSSHDLHFPTPVESVPHKHSIEDMIGDGFLAEAIRNEIYEIRSTFGEKYDGAIGEYLDAMCQYIRENDAPSLKEP